MYLSCVSSPIEELSARFCSDLLLSILEVVFVFSNKFNSREVASYAERGSIYHRSSKSDDIVNRKRIQPESVLLKALDEGPYEFKEFVPEGSTIPRLQTIEDLEGDDLFLHDAEMKVMNMILLYIPNEIYNSVDACTSPRNFGNREALVSVYNRFAQLMNDLERNNMNFPTQFEKLVNASRAKKLEKSHDPLALVAHTGSSSRQTSSYYVTHPTSVVDYDDDYQQDDVHNNFEDPLVSAIKEKDSTSKNKITIPLDYSWISKLEKLEDENVSLDFKVQSLIKERDNAKVEYKKLFDSIKKTRSQTQKEMDELIVHVSEKTYAYGAIRAENQNLLSTIYELKTRLEKVEKDKSVNTKFDKTNGSQSLLCVTPLNKHAFQKKMDVSKREENHVVSKPVTLQTSSTKQKGTNQNKNVIKPGMYRVVTTQESQTNKTKSALSSTGMNATSRVRRPMSRDSHVAHSVLDNSKKAAKNVSVYVRKNKQKDNTSANVISNKENVIDVDVANASKAKTLLCVSCMQNVLIPCHDKCLAKHKLNVHSNCISDRSVVLTVVCSKHPTVTITTEKFHEKFHGNRSLFQIWKDHLFLLVNTGKKARKLLIHLNGFQLITPKWSFYLHMDLRPNESSDPRSIPTHKPDSIHEDSPSTSSIIVDTHEASPVVTTSDEQTSPISLTETGEFDQEDTADFDVCHSFVSYNPPSHEEIESSTTALEPSNVHNFHHVQPSTHIWTKDHSLDQVIGDPSKHVMTHQRISVMLKILWFGTKPLWAKGYNRRSLNFEESFAPVAAA
ncbi:hypothetical protein Tco_0911314 [Tanacetum coccineum]|uniref:Uncharacterized protein n=1 Tax=Tanacetum coccineum TaxID=301880 RepID=A0ABQ5CW87_9ASTR